MSYKYTALFCRRDSAYKKRPYWDVYDADRNALTWAGGTPCVCHPPCRSWGVLAHMSHRSAQDPKAERDKEKQLALWCIDTVRQNGGVIEHPAGSKLFRGPLPDVGFLPDEFGGYTIQIDQYDFGHVAHKMTKLYVCGVNHSSLPPLPPTNTNKTQKSICGNVPGTKRCTQYEREYTPGALIDWIEAVLKLISHD